MTTYKSILTRVEEGPDGLHLRSLTDDEQCLLAAAPALLAERDALRASLRVLLDWCERMRVDDKHLIGSICKEADDLQFRAAIKQAREALNNS